MKKCSKFTKRILSITIALALLTVSAFTGLTIKTNAQEDEKTIIYWDGTYDSTLADNGEAGTEADPIIIDDAAELNYLAVKSGTSTVANTYYKMADGIDIIILQPEDSVNAETLMGLADYNAVKTYLSETITPTAWSNLSGDTVKFAGNFDGNGVEVYGLYSTGTNAGLFPGIISSSGQSVSFKNFAVRNSYIPSSRRVAVIGAYCGTGSVSVKNVEVSNCYITTTGTNAQEMGVLLGRTSKASVTIDSCLVYGNYCCDSNETAIPLYAAIGSGATSAVTNSVILDTAPYPSSKSSATHGPDCFQSSYTNYDISSIASTYGLTDDDLKYIEDIESIKGDNAKTQMPNLTWDEEWVAVDGKIPSLKLFYDDTTTGGENEGGNEGETEELLNIIYWDGSYDSTLADNGEAGTEADPIIIDDAAELNYLAVKSGTSIVANTYYKMADGIDVIILQPEDSVNAETLMGLADYNAVKTYLSETITPTAWSNLSGDTVKFAGNFDGNGVEIYGLYSTGTNAGLFPGIISSSGQSVSFKNFAVRNSYIPSSGRVAVIGAYCGTGSVSVKNVEISNCYLTSTGTAAAGRSIAEMAILLGRTTKSSVAIDNCLVYGNYGYAIGLDKQMPLYGGATSSGIGKVTNSLILGTVPYPIWETKEYTHGVDSFENVYTDQELSTFTTYTDNDIKKINANDILGNAAKTEMPNLTWDEEWVAVDGKIPSLKLFYGETTSGGGENEGGEEPDQPDQPDDPQEPEEVKDCAQNIIYWDNTKTDSKLDDNGEKGTSDDPIIIDSAEELNYLALYTTPSKSTEKHYKIADDIDAIVLQPETTITAMGGVGKLMNLSTPTAVNKYFADMTSAGYTPANWITVNTGNQFNGSVDGNGVKIYGMYAEATSGTNSAEAAGLFPVIDAGGTAANTDVETDFIGVYYKDIAIRNSYISSTRRTGALTAISFGTNYGGKVNGTINMDGIEVSNCYMRATGTSDGEKGVLAGTCGSDLVNINNCLVYNIDASWDKSGTIVPLTLIGTTANIVNDENQSIENTLKNSIILGIAPTPQKDEAKFSKAENVENVYTDYDISTLVSKYSYTDSDMKKLTGTTAEAIGNEIGIGLNNTGKWITVTGGIPTLAAFHDSITVISTTDKTHTLKCACGIECSEAIHSYDKDYKCMLCDYQHVHSMVDVDVESDADCVNGGIMNTKCENCDFVSSREITSSGHLFGAVISATEGDCQTEATVAYKHCSICDLDFSVDADNHSDQPLDNIGTGYTGKHDWVAQPTIVSDCSGVAPIEYFKCSVCDTYLVEGVMSEVEPSELDGHTASGNYFVGENYHANICSCCGDNFSQESHVDSNGDSICDACGWPCGESVFEGASITITDSIAVNYMLKKSVIDELDYQDLHIKFVFGGREYKVTEYTDNGEYYVFTFDDIAPNRMGDIIYATLCGTKDGATYCSKTTEYSISKYCYNMLDKCADDQNTKLRTLLVDLLNYGAQSQIYTDYNCDNLVNAHLTETQKSWGTNEIRELVSHKNLSYATVENPTAKWLGAGLYLDEAATLRFTVETSNKAHLSVKVNCGEKTWDIPSSEFVLRTDTGNGNRYYVYIKGLPVTMMSETVYLTVYDGDVAVSNTICYSVESYAKEKCASSTDSLSQLLGAMMKYGDAAKAYGSK